MLAASLLTGCYKRSVLPQSEGHIVTPAPKPALGSVPPPARISTFVPAPKPTIKPPTYSVVVSEVPVKELLFALARDSKQNIDIHPGLQGLVSLNAIDETLPAILERVAKQVNLRYRVEDNTIIVSPDTAYVKTYRVNYVNMTRETTSTIGVSGQIQAGGGGAGAGAAGGGAGGGGLNASNTVVKTVSNNNFWDAMRDNVRAILNSTRQQSLSAEAKAERAELVKQDQDFRIKQLEATSRAGPGAQPQALAGTVIPASGGVQPATLLPDDVIVNSLAGTLTVNATEKQHQLVQQHLDTISRVSQRQVLIEATIAEVTLSDAYQGGIDWSRLAVSGGITFTQSLIGSITGSSIFPGSLTIGYSNPTSNLGNISATVKLLNQFGNTRVLSSPKLMTLNNQTALLKVVDNIVYFTIEATTTTAANVGTNTVFNTTAQTVPVGMVMSLTPQVNENGQVTLTVRPTITRILDFKNDPNPSLCSTQIAASNAGKCLTNPVPQIQTREMESVLQLISGQTAILGGLMQDNVQYTRNAVPGVGNPANSGVLSELFGMRSDSLTKTELVVFLRSTVITSPSLAGDELKFYQRFLPQQSETPTQAVPDEKAGATR